MTTHDEIDGGELLDTLQIKKVERRHLSTGGTWVTGTIAGHCFQALVFGEHAVNPDYELEDSRISKLWIRRIEDDAVVFNWDRGADVEPTTPMAKKIVGLLAAGLTGRGEARKRGRPEAVMNRPKHRAIHQPEAREGQAGPHRESERPVVRSAG